MSDGKRLKAAIAPGEAALTVGQADMDSLSDAICYDLSAPGAYDLLLVGDGSGSTWDKPCGWCCVLVDGGRWYCKYGASNCGSINVTELEPYLKTMLWYSKTLGRVRHDELRRLYPTELKMLQVHIVTDCDVIANQGNGTMSTKSNPELWLAFNHIRRLGYDFKFHWVPRNIVNLNDWCDRVSKGMRRKICALEQELSDIRLDLITGELARTMA